MIRTILPAFLALTVTASAAGPFAATIHDPDVLIASQDTSTVWEPVNIKMGFRYEYRMDEAACRDFLATLADSEGSVCVNMSTGDIIYP